MNNEKETEKMARIIKPFVTVLCEEDAIAEALVNAGYGNVKQAVKELREKLKDKAEILDDPNGKYCWDAVKLVDINNLITELYGADE